MKLVLFAIVVFIFLILPLLALDALVMPALQTLQNSYQHADATASRIATGK